MRRSLPSWFAVVSVAAALAATAPAVEIAGTYENAGTPLPLDPEVESVSFQGLLELNFDHRLTRHQHAEVERVTIRETDLFLRLECRDRDGRVTWSKRWEKGIGCTFGEDRVELIFRQPALKDDAYVFWLFPLKDKELLLVEVRRVNVTTLGPSVRPAVSFLFARAEPQ